MVRRTMRLVALVLAAGAGSRFSDRGAAKLLAELRGRPLLSRVLDQVRAYGPADTVVILGHAAEQIEGAIDWRGERRLRNPDPTRGISSSLQLGIHALAADRASYDGAFIVLGDQPLLRAEVMNALADAAARARPADRPAVVPRYEDQAGPRNPVLLLRPAWSWVDELAGDRGLGELIEQRPDMVQEVPVEGAMPDVDTRGDLKDLETLIR